MNDTIVIILLLIYFTPSFIAWENSHVNKTGIQILNLFLGWTFVGWVIALIWSVHKSKNNN